MELGLDGPTYKALAHVVAASAAASGVRSQGEGAPAWDGGAALPQHVLQM